MWTSTEQPLGPPPPPPQLSSCSPIISHRKRNGRKDWSRIDSLPDLFIRPEDRGNIRTFINHAPPPPPPPTTTTTNATETKPTASAPSPSSPSRWWDFSRHTTDVAAAERSNLSKRKIKDHSDGNKSDGRRATGSHHRRHHHRRRRSSTGASSTTTTTTTTTKTTTNKYDSKGDDYVEKTSLTVRSLVSPKSNRRRKRSVKIDHTTVATTGRSDDTVIGTGNVPKIDLPFEEDDRLNGDDSKSVGGGTITVTSWLNTKKPLKSAMKKKSKKDKKKEQKSKTTKKGRTGDSSDTTSATTQSIVATISSSSTISIQGMTATVSSNREDPVVDRWGGPLTNRSNRRKDDTPTLPPHKPARHGCSVSPSSIPEHHGLDEKTLPPNNELSESFSEMPPLTRYSYEDGDDDTTADLQSIDKSSHQTTGSTASECNVGEASNDSDHGTIKSTDTPPICNTTSVDKSSFDFDTPTTVSVAKAAINHQETTSASPTIVRPSIDDTPVQKPGPNMKSLKQSPTSVVQALPLSSIIPPLSHQKTDKSSESSHRQAVPDAEEKVVKLYPNCNATHRSVPQQVVDNEHEFEVSSITTKQISPLNPCVSTSICQSPTQHPRKTPSPQHTQKKRSDKVLWPKVETAVALVSLEWPQKPSDGSSVRDKKAGNNSQTADITTKEKMPPSRIATNKTCIHRYDSSFSGASFGSLDLNDVHTDDGPPRHTFGKKPASRPPPPVEENEHALSPILQERKKLHYSSTGSKMKKERKERRRQSTGAMINSDQNDNIGIVDIRTGERNSISIISHQGGKKERRRSTGTMTHTKQAHDGKREGKRDLPPLSPRAKSPKKAVVSTTNVNHTDFTSKSSDDSQQKQKTRRGSTGGCAKSMAKLWEEKLIPSMSPHQSISPPQRFSPMSTGGGTRSRKIAAKWESIFNPPF